MRRVEGQGVFMNLQRGETIVHLGFWETPPEQQLRHIKGQFVAPRKRAAAPTQIGPLDHDTRSVICSRGGSSRWANVT